MKLILVPTDLSPASQNATNYASHLCRRSGGTLILLHVYMLPVPVSELPYAMVSAEEVHNASEVALKKEAERIYKEAGVKPECIVRLGLPSDEIRDLEQERDIDLVVMGMKGAGEFDKIIGSTTIAVIRKCRKAVLVIPHNATFVPYKVISYATDYSYQTDLSFFEPLKSFLANFNTKLLVVHVQKTAKAMTPQQVEASENIRNIFADIVPVYHVVEDNDIEHGLHQFLEKHTPDMLAMVSHKHNFLDRLFGTHHTKTMIYQASIPVLILQDKN